MKAVLAKLGIAAVVAITPLVLQAQVEAVVYGRSTITLAPALLQGLAGAGATITDLNTLPLQNGATTLTTIGGAFDVSKGPGEAIFNGGYIVSVKGSLVRIQDLVLTVTPTSSSVSGLFILNDTIIGRQPVFDVISFPATVPRLQNGVLVENGLGVGLAANFVSLINQALGTSTLAASTPIGTVDIYEVFAPFAPGVD